MVFVSLFLFSFPPDNQMLGLVRQLGELPSKSYFGRAKWHHGTCIYVEPEENVGVTLTEPDLAMG